MYTATGSTDSRLKPTPKTGLFLAQNAKSKKSGLALAKWAATWLIWGMNHFQKQSQRCITSTMKLHPAPLWPGWNLSSHYQQAARSKQHGGSTVTAVVGVAAPAAPTSADPPTYTPAEQSPYHSSLFPIKMSAKSQESHGAESPAGLGRSRAGCTGKHGGPEALIKMAMTPLRRTHTRFLIHTEPSLSLSASASGIHLQASLQALLEVPAGSSLLSMETDVGGNRKWESHSGTAWRQIHNHQRRSTAGGKQLPSPTFSELLNAASSSSSSEMKNWTFTSPGQSL